MVGKLQDVKARRIRIEEFRKTQGLGVPCKQKAILSMLYGNDQRRVVAAVLIPKTATGRL